MKSKVLFIAFLLSFFLVSAEPVENGPALFLGLTLTFLVFSAMILIPILIVLATIFWIFMIVDCAKRDFKKDDEKIIWILVLVFLQFFGAVLYYFIVKRNS